MWVEILISRVISCRYCQVVKEFCFLLVPSILRITLQYILLNNPQRLQLLKLTIPILLNLPFTGRTNESIAILAQSIYVF